VNGFAGLDGGLGAAEGGFDLAVEDGEGLFEVVAVWGRASAGRDVHVDEAVFSGGVFGVEQHGVGVSDEADVGVRFGVGVGEGAGWVVGGDGHCCWMRRSRELGHRAQGSGLSLRRSFGSALCAFGQDDRYWWRASVCSGLVFLGDDVAEFGVFGQVVGDEGADDVDLEVLFAGVFEGGAGEGGGDAAAAQGGWDFGVPEGHPSLVVAVEFEPGGFSVLFEFEAGFCDFAGVGHGESRVLGTRAQGLGVSGWLEWAPGSLTEVGCFLDVGPCL
jgi:hypothetical protein